MSVMMYGKCEICKQERSLQHTYFRYSPEHFTVVTHCPSCVPKPPKEYQLVQELRTRLQHYEAIIETLKDGVNTLLTTNPNQDLINDALEVLARLEVSHE